KSKLNNPHIGLLAMTGTIAGKKPQPPPIATPPRSFHGTGVASLCWRCSISYLMRDKELRKQVLDERRVNFHRGCVECSTAFDSSTIPPASRCQGAACGKSAWFSEYPAAPRPRSYRPGSNWCPATPGAHACVPLP